MATNAIPNSPANGVFSTVGDLQVASWIRNGSVVSVRSSKLDYYVEETQAAGGLPITGTSPQLYANPASSGVSPTESQYTTEELINSVDLSDKPVGFVIETTGYSSRGDGGHGKWIKTSETGPASQSPSQKAIAKFNDAEGVVWELILSGENRLESLGGSSLGSSHIAASVATGGSWCCYSNISITSKTVINSNKYKLETSPPSVVSMDYDTNTSGKFLTIPASDVHVYIDDLKGNTSTQVELTSLISISGDNVRCFGNFRDVGDICIFSSSSDTDTSDSTLVNCGTKNRQTGLDSDRRQGIAFSGAARPKANRCRMDGIGLDFISFATNCSDVEARDCFLHDNNAGGIYNSNTDGFDISGNTVSGDPLQTKLSGHGIDNINSKNGKLNGNTCRDRGASGILIGDGCEKINADSNMLYRNGQSEQVGNKGGFSLIGQLREVTLGSNNIAYDDGVVKSQRYAIDSELLTSAIDLTIQKANYKGYSGGGSESMIDIVSSSSIGAQQLQSFKNYNSLDSSVIEEYDNSSSLTKLNILNVFIINTNQLVRFMYRKGSVKIIYDETNAATITDSGSGISVHPDGDFIRFKNRYTSTRTLSIWKD